jgi:hypothetical protein
MSEDRNPADGPGEAVIDEPTEHALDPTPDPNNEWEEKAAEQVESGSGKGSDEDENSTAETDEETG